MIVVSMSVEYSICLVRIKSSNELSCCSIYHAARELARKSGALRSKEKLGDLLEVCMCSLLLLRIVLTRIISCCIVLICNRIYCILCCCRCFCCVQKCFLAHQCTLQGFRPVSADPDNPPMETHGACRAMMTPRMARGTSDLGRRRMDFAVRDLGIWGFRGLEFRVLGFGV